MLKLVDVCLVVGYVFADAAGNLLQFASNLRGPRDLVKQLNVGVCWLLDPSAVTSTMLAQRRRVQRGNGMGGS